MTIDQQQRRFAEHDRLWLFGYGSLIWKADFDYSERRSARLRGWSRRFWQGSHDHRGTAEAPGRVVTLIEAGGTQCDGLAYLIEPQVLDHLDSREQNGYQRHTLPLMLDDGRDVMALVYIAPKDNPAWLGPASDREMARQIATAVGPSGRNRDYLSELAQALRRLDANDAHVFSIQRQLELLDAPD